MQNETHILLPIIAVLMVTLFMVGMGCGVPPASGTPQNTDNPKDISAFTLSYAAISITVGTATSSRPSWENQGASISPAVSYTLKKGADAPPAGVSIDSSTGAISIAATAAATASGTYTVTATGT